VALPHLRQEPLQVGRTTCGRGRQRQVEVPSSLPSRDVRLAQDSSACRAPSDALQRRSLTQRPEGVLRARGYERSGRFGRRSARRWLAGTGARLRPSCQVDAWPPGSLRTRNNSSRMAAASLTNAGHRVFTRFSSSILFKPPAVLGSAPKSSLHSAVPWRLAKRRNSCWVRSKAGLPRLRLLWVVARESPEEDGGRDGPAGPPGAPHAPAEGPARPRDQPHVQTAGLRFPRIRLI
jgi:hypothetical protein